MPTPRRIVVLNVGSQTIGHAEFRLQPMGGLVLHAHQTREALIDPTNPRLDEAERESLHELVAELRTQRCTVNYAIAPQSVFARFVKLPPIEEEKIQRIVEFEAQQNVPFPIEEVVWDYQVIGGGGTEEIEVVIVAIKADLLDEINRAVEETGLRTAVVDVATMALYNAFRYNYPELDGCSLLLDIGARTTNLLFIEPDRLFTRSIPIGGSSVTVAISKEFSEPFAAADMRKKRDVDVAPSEANLERIAKFMRVTMTRLHAEVLRSISHYSTQQHGNTPQRLFLCGGMAGAFSLHEFFSEKLHVPVEFFNPLRNVAIAPTLSIDVTRSAHLLGELVGLALRSIIRCPMSLNLRPAVVARRHELERRRPFFVIAAAAILLALIGWSFFFTRAAKVLRGSADQIRQIDKAMRVTEEKIDKLRQQVASIEAVAAPLVNAIHDRFFWVQVLEDLNSRLPNEDIWITEFVPTAAGQLVGFDDKHPVENLSVPAPTRSKTKDPATGLVIDGLLLRGLYLYNPKQQEVVIDYFRSLAGSPFFKVDPNNQARAVKTTIPNSTEWAFPYELRLELKKPIKLL